MSAIIAEPRKQSVQESDIASFARSLGLARAVWKKYPHLVESPEMTEPFLTAFRQDEGYEPDEMEIMGDEEALTEAGLLKTEPAKS